MYRNLHITIHEDGRAARSGGTAARRGPSGNPEEYEQVVPKPNNPEEYEQVVPKPNNPEEYEQVVPRPNNPEGGGYWLQGGSGYGGPAAGVYETAGYPAPVCCCPCDGKDKAPERPGAGPGDYSGFVIVRLATGLKLDFQTLWELAQRPGFEALRAVLELPEKPPADDDGSTGAAARIPAVPPGRPGGGTADPVTPGWLEPRGRRILVSRPLVEPHPAGGPSGRDEMVEAIRGLEQRARKSPFAPLHSLASYFRVDFRPYPELLEEAVRRFGALREVDLAYRELVAGDPGTGSALLDDQGYLDAAPVGIGAAAIWEHLAGMQPPGPPAPQLTVCDLEQGWSLDHLELGKVEKTPFYGVNRAIEEPDHEGDHGTAVLGQLTAAGTGPYSVHGVAAGAGRFVLTSHYRSRTEPKLPLGSNANSPSPLDPHPFAGTGGHVAAAIVHALLGALTGGDVLLLEVQRGRLPTEVDAADFDAIRLATALQVTVVEAAGNGGIDLDGYVDPDTRRSLARGGAGFRDSGAIFVGAGRAALPHDRCGFSNYGSRLDCFAWGESVSSCGYGDLGGGNPTDYYTNTFSGTSSAAPVIAGAAALVQRLRRATGLDPLRPQAMRAVLSDPLTGTRQGPNVAGFIGSMPDLGAVLRGRLQLVPDVYQRAWIGDDGARPVPGDEPISSSPDIIPLPAGAQIPPNLDNDLAGAHNPAPGDIVASGKACDVHVRLHNRGGADGDVRVELFASPAATLITPDRWQRIASSGVATMVERGGLSEIAGLGPAYTPASYWPPVDAKGVPLPGATQGEYCYSFLAVQRPAAPADPWRAERLEGLPPGPPYFDWDEYRAFLRGPGVAWRNVHRVKAATQQLRLAFYIAGTPDRARGFDLEVLQRLPAGMPVDLTVPGPFGAKLRQGLPQVGPGGGTNAWDTLPVQPSPRASLGRVELAAGARIWSVLSVGPGKGPPLKHGHSIAIRQLWNGEEVGRITWWFVA